MSTSDFGQMYPNWNLITLEERVAKMLAFRAWEGPPDVPLATCAALNKSYADEHWLEYLQSAKAIINEVLSSARRVG